MTGTLRELPKSKSGERRWELRVFVGRGPAPGGVNPKTGKPRQGPVLHRSKVVKGVGIREARHALTAFVSEVGTENNTGTRATFSKLLDDWLASLPRLGKARSTIERYTNDVKTHIKPALGLIRLDKLTAHDLDNYFAALEAKGLAASTIRLNHAIVSAALTQGVKWKWIPSNPAKDASLADKVTTKTKALTVDQIRTLYTKALEDDEDMAVTIVLAALTGCRRGELCGLKWGDVDWEKASLTVERQWVPGKGGQHLTATTKTGNGRTVFVGALGLELLKRYQAAKTELVGHEPTGWLLSADGGTTPLRAKGVSAYVVALGKKVKVPVVFHTLRHFAATELVHAGVDLPTAARQLGHSPAVMAGTYLHTSDERGAAAGELIAAVIGKALEPK